MRGSRAFTCAHFARKAGVSTYTLRGVERNRGPISLEMARKIGAALEVDLRTFAKAISRRPA